MIQSPYNIFNISKGWENVSNDKESLRFYTQILTFQRWEYRLYNIVLKNFEDNIVTITRDVW